jgi:putative Mn2+ efflux pump MntP
VFGLFLVAASLGASNLAASVGIGMAGVDNRTRIRVGLFEAGMPLIGLTVGRVVSQQIGSAGHVVGASLLIAVGAYIIAQGVRSGASLSRTDLWRSRTPRTSRRPRCCSSAV